MTTATASLVEKLYDKTTIDWYNTHHMAIDIRSCVSFDPKHKEIMEEYLFFTSLAGTQRNFREPTLKRLQVVGRTGILREMATDYVGNFRKIATYKAITLKDPTSDQDLAKFGLRLIAYHWRVCPDFAERMKQYKAVAKTLKQVSVWEWLSCHMNEHPPKQLFHKLLEDEKTINKYAPSKRIQLNRPWNMAVGTHEDFLQTLVSQGYRKP